MGCCLLRRVWNARPVLSYVILHATHLSCIFCLSPLPCLHSTYWAPILARSFFLSLSHMLSSSLLLSFLSSAFGKVYFRSQILECPSIGEYWNIFWVPVLPENVIFMVFRTCWCYSEAYNTGTQKWSSIVQYSCTSIWDKVYFFPAFSLMLVPLFSPLLSSFLFPRYPIFLSQSVTLSLSLHVLLFFFFSHLSYIVCIFCSSCFSSLYPSLP